MYNNYSYDSYGSNWSMDGKMHGMDIYKNNAQLKKSKHHGYGEKCVKVPEVVGRNYCQILLENVIPFAPCHPALEIKDIKKKVKDLNIKVCKNKVLINGVLHKNINYKTLEKTHSYKHDCQSYRIKYGNVKHVAVDLPFSCYIEIPGAREGDYYEVEYAGVEDSCEIVKMLEPVKYRDCCITLYKKMKEKCIVKIDIKVLRHCQITILPNKPNICP